MTTTSLATTSLEGAALYVVFKLASAEYAIPSSLVLQMEAFTGATPVPGTVAYIAGVMPIRGKVVPVVDLRVRFGLPAVPPTLESRVVVGQLGDRTVALLTDTAREVMRIAPGDVKPPPPMIDQGSAGFVSAIAHVGGRLLLLLDFAKIIGEEPVNVP